MPWDFSVIRSHVDMETIEQDLHDHINTHIAIFSQRYRDISGAEIKINETNAIDSFGAALGVVRRLYVERIRDMLLPDPQDRDEGRRSAKILFQSGNLQPFCDFIEQRYFKIFDNRDYRWANELTLKTAFLTVLFDDRLYMIDSETELERTYADLTLIRRPELRGQPQALDFLMEFKYAPLTEAGLSGAELRQLQPSELQAIPIVQEKLAEARRQLQRHRQVL